MSDYPMPPAIGLMTPEKARDIARSLKQLATSYEEANMQREASKANRDAMFFIAYAVALSQISNS